MMETTGFYTTAGGFAVSALLAIIVGNMAKKKGYAFAPFYAFGVFNFVVALIVAACVPKKKPDESFAFTRPQKGLTLACVVLFCAYAALKIIGAFVFSGANDMAALQMLLSNLSSILALAAFVFCMYGAARAKEADRAYALSFAGLLSLAVEFVAANLLGYLYSTSVQAIRVSMSIMCGGLLLVLALAVLKKEARTVRILRVFCLVYGILYILVYLLTMVEGNVAALFRSGRSFFLSAVPIVLYGLIFIFGTASVKKALVPSSSVSPSPAPAPVPAPAALWQAAPAAPAVDDDRTVPATPAMDDDCTVPAAPVAGADGGVPFAPYTGGGVCDVCNRPLSGETAYRVPNDVFYASAQWRAYFKNLQNTLSGMQVTDADIERMRQRDTSPGSAVCDHCIHMFR